MKFVMSLVLAATFATSAFASEKQKQIEAVKSMGELKQRLSEEKQKEIDAIKSMGELKEQLSKAAQMNEEEKRGAKAYRLDDIKDPNEVKASKTEKSVTVRPWTGSNRKRILTPVEYEREEREGKYSTYAGSEVGKNYSTVYGAKVKIKLGGAKQ